MIDYLAKFKLTGKVAVVCGGLGLIGKEVSVALAQAGARVLVLDINCDAGVDFAKECSDNKLDVKFLRFDSTDLNNHRAFIDGLIEKEGAIQVWINVAYPRTSDWGDRLENIKIESWQKNVDVHLNSYCILTRDIAEVMKSQGIKGTIINYGSTYGVVSPDFEVYAGTDMTSAAAYAAIKGGIINFSRYCASHYGGHGVRVNCICPGGVFDNQNPVFVANYERRTPLKRMGRTDEIAAATLFLASDAASYVTGATFMVDGGWTCI